MARGYFEIGIVGGKTPANLGTLWRTAYQLGASGIFTIGKRYGKQPSDTSKAWKHIPLRFFDSFDEFLKTVPAQCVLVGIETCGKPLVPFAHPERAVYLLGAEDHGLSSGVLSKCDVCVSVPSVRWESYNVAVAGSIVMFDRLTKAKP